MALWVIWTAAFYLLLKVLRVAFGPRAGLEPQEFNFRAAARMGEPTVLIEAVLISLCATLYVQWSTTRLGAREIGHSTICYGQLAAADEEVSPERCIKWEKKVKDSGGDIHLIEFAGAAHNFDDPSKSKQEVPANAHATRASEKRAEEFFAKYLLH